MKALRVILFAVLMLTAEQVFPAAMTTLTNFNAVYFLVDPDPAATPTNVVLLTGNLTNWQKLGTNLTLAINPTDTYLPRRFDANTFVDSHLNDVGNSTLYTLGGTNIIEMDRSSPAGRLRIYSPDHTTTMSLTSDNSGVTGLGSTGAFTVYSAGYNVTFQTGNLLATSAMDLGSWSYPWDNLFVTNSIHGGTATVTSGIVTDSSGRLTFGTNNVSANGTISATNGYLHQFKSSFSTNYSIGTSTNQQFFLLNGTNQLITLPPVAGVRGIIYRFSMTNGYGSFILTNAADSATIRDGTSSSYTNIGINEVGFLSDGSNWWLASKGKQIFPAASWSLNATISPVQDVITNIPWDTLEFNNSQGIALKTNATFAKPTQLWITNSGTYMITFSAVLKGSAGGSKLSIWLRKDGSDVSRTRTDQGFSGSTAQQCMTVNYFVAVSAPCFYELVAASHDATPPTIEYGAANPTGYTAPAMPAIILTINRVSDTWP